MTNGAENERVDKQLKHERTMREREELRTVIDEAIQTVQDGIYAADEIHSALQTPKRTPTARETYARAKGPPSVPTRSHKEVFQVDLEGQPVHLAPAPVVDGTEAITDPMPDWAEKTPAGRTLGDRRCSDQAHPLSDSLG